jgi:hypothetical protein
MLPKFVAFLQPRIIWPEMQTKHFSLTLQMLLMTFNWLDSTIRVYTMATHTCTHTHTLPPGLKSLKSCPLKPGFTIQRRTQIMSGLIKALLINPNKKTKVKVNYPFPPLSLGLVVTQLTGSASSLLVSLCGYSTWALCRRQMMFGVCVTEPPETMLYIFCI